MTLMFFYLSSAVAIASALAVILASKPTRALIALIVAMAALAVIYVLLGAVFVAMAHLVVYAGAILVLFLFVIMLQGIGAQELPLLARFHPAYLAVSCFVAAAFAVLVLLLYSRAGLPVPSGVVGTTEAVGRLLFRNYLLPFELTSLLLLLGVFAAVSLANREDA